MGLVDCTYLISLILLLTSPKAAAKDDIEEAIDAYTRKDYVQLGIKLIEIKFSIDPPEQYSTEQLQLLIARLLLVKVHPYYLYWFPNKTSAGNSSSFTNETDSSSESSALPKSFNLALNLLDYGTDQISTGINNLLGLGVKVIKNMAQIPQPKTMEKGEGEKVETSMDNNSDTKEDVTANPHKQSKEHSSSENLGGSNLLSDTVSVLTNAAIQTAGDVIGALTSNDLHSSVDKENKKSKSNGSITDQSLKLNHSDAKENNGQKVNKKVKVQQKPSSSTNKSNTKLKNNASSKRSDNLKNGTNKINCNKNQGKSSNCTISKQQNTNKTNTKIKRRKTTTSNHRKK